jgi:hypothetical protein
VCGGGKRRDAEGAMPEPEPEPELVPAPPAPPPLDAESTDPDSELSSPAREMRRRNLTLLDSLGELDTQHCTVHVGGLRTFTPGDGDGASEDALRRQYEAELRPIMSLFGEVMTCNVRVRQSTELVDGQMVEKESWALVTYHFSSEAAKAIRGTTQLLKTKGAEWPKLYICLLDSEKQGRSSGGMVSVAKAKLKEEDAQLEDTLTEDAFAAAVKALKKVKLVCDNQYDTIRLDSRKFLQEAVMLDLFSQCARDRRLVKPAEELMVQCLTMPTPLPISDEMIGVVVCACAERGRVHGAMSVVNAASRGHVDEHRTPVYALGSLIEVLVQEDGSDSAHDAFVFYQMMLRGAYADEPLPWPGVSALCCKQLRLASSLSKPLTDITANEAENERKMWLRRTVAILEEYRAAQVQPDEDIIDLLEAPAWEGSDTTCWNYIDERGWSNLPHGCEHTAWLAERPVEPARLRCEIEPEMLVTIQNGKVEATAELSALYEMEPEPIPTRLKNSLKLLQAACSELEMAVVDVVLEYLLALKCPHPTTPQLAECVHGRKHFMQRHLALQHRLAQENKKNANEESRTQSIEQKAVYIQLLWRTRMRRRQRNRRVREAQLILFLQRRMRTHIFFNRIKRKVARRRAHQEKKWDRLQSSFSKDWARISKGRRVEVHVPSLSLPEHHRYAGELNIGAREDLQLGRIVARALDPNVFVRHTMAAHARRSERLP